ncbi:MAG TPA: hypothetical protein VE592_11370 [Geminicoccaceae bacterium]|jgi:hypothetical protein|nr:hypothetical protein [Geminicoccaceae bacterium]
MVRRTITLPEALDDRVRAAATDDESFSAAIARLVDAGLSADRRPPAYVGAGASGVDDLGTRAEDYLRQLFADR